MDLKTYLLPAVLCLPLAAAGQGVYPQCLRLVQDTWQLMAFIQVCDEKSLPSDAVLENVAEQMGKQIEICDRQLDEAAQKRLQHDLSTYIERQQSRGIDENAVRRQCNNIDRTLDDMLKRYQSQTQGRPEQHGPAVRLPETASIVAVMGLKHTYFRPYSACPWPLPCE